MLKRIVGGAAALAVGMLVLAGCTNFVRASVDSLAAAQGFITQAQANHLPECSNWHQGDKDFPCVTINQAVDAQNAAVSALEVYCQLPVAPDPATLASVGTQACNANPSAKQVLVNALANLNQILASYKTLSGGKP